MSSYPPPPPQGYAGPGQTPAAGGYPPYNGAAWQQQTPRQQARMLRQQLKAQRRALRRRSIVGPLIILVLGIALLLVQLGRISWPDALDWWGHWWPLVLVAAGLLLLLEWFVENRQRSSSPGSPPVRVVGGGVIFLLVLLAVAGASSHWLQEGVAWKTDVFGSGLPLWSFALGDRREMDDTADGTIAPNGTLLIRNPNGDVTVTGSSDDGKIHVSVHKSIRARNDEDAESRRQRLQPTFSGTESNVVLSVVQIDGGNDDLTVQVPHNTVLTVNADHGAVNVQEMHAPVSITAGNGEVNLSGITGDVSAHMNSSDAAFSAHSVNGGITVEGHAGDINLSDIVGPVSLQGEFFGTTHIERANGAIEFHTKRTQFESARIDGELNIEGGSDLEADSVMGPLVLQTAYRNITLDRIQGSVKVTNRDGSVTLTDAPPIGAIDINNQHGSVDVGVPENAAFVLNAQTNDGDIENDFGLQQNENGHVKSIAGTVGSGGAPVNIHTTDGDITVRKSIVSPLPPAPPATPKISDVPSAPAIPKAPTTPKIPAKPKTPATPAADGKDSDY